MEIDPIAKTSIKIVAVGDKLVGKSCAITTYLTYNQAILHQVHLSKGNLQSSTALHVILKLMDPLTIFQYGKF